MKAASVLGVLMAAALVAAQQPTPAEALRAAPKSFSVVDIPDNYRAVSFETEGGGLGMYGLYGFGYGMSGDANRKESDTLLFGLMTSSWVDPEEFQAALDGKLPRVRTLTLNLAGMIRNGSDTPAPVFAETWIESSRIARWTPRTELTKAALVKAFGPSAIPGEPRTGPTDGLSKVKQVAISALLYASDWDDVLPKADSTAKATKVLMPYAKDQSIFSTKNPAGKRILYNTGLSGVPSTSLSAPAETILFFEEFAWSDGKRAVAFADGHASRLTDNEWSKAWSAELRRRAMKGARAATKKR